MSKVTNWGSYQYYQHNGCQIPRKTGKSKCGRTAGLAPCIICGTQACGDCSVYLQIRVFGATPLRVQTCEICFYADAKGAHEAMRAALAEKLGEQATQLSQRLEKLEKGED